jgi:hypothetical protein
VNANDNHQIKRCFVSLRKSIIAENDDSPMDTEKIGMAKRRQVVGYADRHLSLCLAYKYQDHAPAFLKNYRQM